MNITKLALRRPVSAILIVLSLIVFGISSIFGFKLELQPDMEMPMLLVVTVYPGADPASVEELVTKEIEAAGSKLSGIDTYMSQSSENSSVVMFSYDYDIDIDDAYLDLRAALDTASANLPEDARDPYIMELSVDAMDTMTISATAVGDIDLFSYVENTIVPELETIISIADVNVYGGRENYIKVQLDENAMKQYGLTMSSIAQYIAAIDFSVPAGTVTQGTQDLSVASSAETKNISELRDIPLITSTGSLITLNDVADIYESSKEAGSISRYNGDDNISIGVQKKQSYGTVNAAGDVKKVLETIQNSNDAVNIDVVYDASDAIISSLTSVAETLVLGIILSMIVLFLFFGDFKASLIVGSAMPVSLLATLILMNMMDFSLNIVTTSSLVIAIGMMVDSSIVVIESCFRLKEEKADFAEAAQTGTKIVSASIIASTITTIVVYLPLSVMTGLSGQIFVQLGFTIIFAMLASLITALTLVPLFFTKFKPKEKTELPINRLLTKINSRYEKILRKILYRKKTAVAVALLFLAASFAMVANMNKELMPQIDEGAMAIKAQFRSGTTLQKVEDDIAFIEEMVKADEKVENYAITISNSSATITAYLRDDLKAPTSDVIEEYNTLLAGVPDMDISIAASGTNMSSMLTTDKEVDISGYDLDILKKEAEKVEAAMKTVPGVIRVSSDISKAATEADVVVDPLKAMSVGLTPIQVAMELNYALSGMEAVTLTDQGQEYSVRLEYPDGSYTNMYDLMNMTISSPYGMQVPLTEIASVQYTDAPETIVRVDGVYQVAVTAATTNAARFTASQEIDRLVEKIEFENGVYRSESTMDTMIFEEFKSIIIAIFTAVFLVFLVMAMQFESPRFSGMVMMSVPFSFIGSFSLLFVTGSTLSMVSLMGILMLVGIVVNNGILYVDTANMLRESMPLEEALIQSGQLRLRPILMTTLTTILSMIPLSFGIGDGGDMMQGMALVIIGGLVASTVLILLLMPTFYLIIDKKIKKEEDSCDK